HSASLIRTRCWSQREESPRGEEPGFRRRRSLRDRRREFFTRSAKEWVSAPREEAPLLALVQKNSRPCSRSERPGLFPPPAEPRSGRIARFGASGSNVATGHLDETRREHFGSVTSDE